MLAAFDQQRSGWAWLVEQALRVGDLDPFLEISARQGCEIGVGKSGFSYFPHFRHSKIQQESNELAELLDIDSAVSQLRPSRPVIISVATDLCFRRTLELPYASRRTIARVLDLDLSSATPFQPADVYSGHRVLETGGADSLMTIEQIILRRDLLEPLKQGLAQRRVPLRAIVFRESSGGLLSLALNADGKAFGGRAYSHWIRILAMSMALLIVSAGISAAVSNYREAGRNAELAARVEVLEQKAVSVRDRLDVIKSSTVEIAELRRWKSNGGRALKTVEEMSRLIPDNTFLEGLSLDGAAVTIDGQSASPEGLITLLESSLLFEKAAFTSPVFRNSGEAYSHFTLQLEIESSEAASPP